MPKKDADAAFDAATCIGCGACVAACPNASSMLFTAAKVTHLGLLPQGQPERDDRVVNMVAQQDAEGFGGCTNIGECSAACPKGISMETISRLNHDLLGALRAGARPKSWTRTRPPHPSHARGETLAGAGAARAGAGTRPGASPGSGHFRPWVRYVNLDP